MGYNPKKPGRASFHPLFCFIGETRDFLHGIFRTGKAHSGRGVKRFVDECLKMISEGIREIFLRADSGFYDGDSVCDSSEAIPLDSDGTYRA